MTVVAKTYPPCRQVFVGAVADTAQAKTYPPCRQAFVGAVADIDKEFAGLLPHKGRKGPTAPDS